MRNRIGRCQIMKERVYIVRPAVFAPAILSSIALAFAVRESWWYFVALPFIWLGSVCAQPNMNGADGCMAYLAMIVGFIVTAFFKPLGLAILAGAASGFYASAFEKWMRLRPALDAMQPKADVEHDSG
jgi:hypothetical protein